MDKVKAALTDFTSRSGHHDTTVHETVAPGVTHETVKPHQHENINTAVDKEVHQDHYHRTVQPVHDREVLPEQHTAKLGAVQHREFDHRDHDHVQRSLAQEQAQFKNERRVEGTTSSQSVAPTVGGEHVHHHIHETIQPVVKKEVVQPNVVHTTVPIHEVHHNKATHHESTALPAMTMQEFKQKGGALSGREERFDEFEGVPKNIGGGTSGGFGSHRDGQTAHHTGSDHHRHGDYQNDPNHGGSHHAGTTGAAVAGAAGVAGASHHNKDHVGTGHQAGGLTGTGHQSGLTDQGHQTGLTGQGHQSGLSGTHDSSLGRDNVARESNLNNTAGVGSTGHVGTDGTIGNSHTKAEVGSGLDKNDLPKALTEDKSRFNAPTGHGTTGQHNTTGQHGSNTSGSKPGLMDKLNPMKDSDGDGKKGFMK